MEIRYIFVIALVNRRRLSRSAQVVNQRLFTGTADANISTFELRIVRWAALHLRASPARPDTTLCSTWEHILRACGELSNVSRHRLGRDDGLII